VKAALPSNLEASSLLYLIKLEMRDFVPTIIEIEAQIFPWLIHRPNVESFFPFLDVNQLA